MDKQSSGEKAAKSIIADSKLAGQIKWHAGKDFVKWSEKMIEIFSDKDAAHLLRTEDTRVCLTKEELIKLAKDINQYVMSNNKRHKLEIAKLDMTISSHQGQIKIIEEKISGLGLERIRIESEILEEQFELAEERKARNSRSQGLPKSESSTNQNSSKNGEDSSSVGENSQESDSNSHSSSSSSGHTHQGNTTDNTNSGSMADNGNEETQIADLSGIFASLPPSA